MPFKFSGGVHPPIYKSLTCDKSIKKGFVPKKVMIPLAQHVGAPAEPVVNVGDQVTAGALIGKAGGFISSPVHASISGKVARITYSPTPNLGRVPSILIESDGTEDQEFKISPRPGVEGLSSEELIAIIKDAGIVGLGGAAFPSHVKLSPPKGKTIDTVILNGAECEPYLTCDHRLMVERPADVLKGLGIIVKILGVKKAYIAIEDNKPGAIETMTKAVKELSDRVNGAEVAVTTLKTKYPQGAEKQLIRSVTGRIVPAGGLPMDVGCVVQNVGTAVAIMEAVYLSKPLFERTITVTGSCRKEPANMTVRVGTLISDIIESLGGFKHEPRK
ncbi:MAG: RnfABCDGE type electron transport complex subunit C, partial [Candidatus Omnitrophica bacterium]|nr:RnfABCDGE type electron transport complex subunit C [Candidatus Omnitrophota bacterium]